MDKTPHLAVENEKEDVTGQQEQQPLHGIGAEIYERGLAFPMQAHIVTAQK